MNEAGQVDIAEYLQFPGVTPCRLIDLLERASGDVAGIVDKDIDAGGFAREALKIIRFAQVDSMRNDVDLMSGAQTFGQRLHRLGAARGQMHIAAFFGKCFSGRCADPFRCASDQHALSA